MKNNCKVRFLSNIVLFVIFLILGSRCLVCQTINVGFEHIGTKDGLSQNDINCIYQDNRGFMWFGTYDGLNRYDGYSFKKYLPSDNDSQSISSNIIFCIAGGKEDILWIGTTGGGLNRFDPKQEKFITFRNNPLQENSIDSDVIKCVFRDKSNLLWIGTNEGLNILNLEQSPDNYNFQHVLTEKITPISEVYEDSKGNIYAIGSGSIYEVIKNSNGDYELNRIDFDKDFIGNIFGIKEADNGDLFIGTNQGLFKISKNRRNEPDPKILGLKVKDFLINKGKVWLGTSTGLHYYELGEDGKTEISNQFKYDPVDPESISKNIINVLYEDRSGIIWIGTNGGGINKLNPRKKKFQHVRHNSTAGSLSYDKIRSIHQDSYDNLWIGTEGGGLNLLTKKDIENNQFNRFRKFEKISKVYAMNEVKLKSKSLLLLGNGDKMGIYALDLENIQKNKDVNIYRLLPTKGSVFSIYQDSQNIIWVGTYNGGLYRLIETENEDLKISRFINQVDNDFSISGNIIRNIYEDDDKNIWIGTENGISMLSVNERTKNKPKFSVYRNETNNNYSLSNNYVMPIYEASTGDLFIGTFGGGLNKYIPAKNKEKGKFTRFGLNEGLPNNVVKSILEDNNKNLWLSTNSGLSKFNLETESFVNYNMNDGLQDNEFQELTATKLNDGSLIFGGVNGLNVFLPEMIKTDDLAPETLVTNFSLFNKKVETGKKYEGNILLDKTIGYTHNISLNHNQNSFAFEFTSLQYGTPLKNRFSYQLLGYDEDWIFTNANKRLANYTNIPPGNYTFLVKSSNGDDVWDDTPISIDIKVAYPFWRTNIAYVLYGIITLLLLLAFRRYTIIRTTKKHQFELEHINKSKQEELQQAKLQFFTNISHELRTPLTLIKGPLQFIQEFDELKKHPELKEQTSIMGKNVDYLLKLVNQLLDFRKINQGKMHLVVRRGDIIKFIEDIGQPFQFVAHNKNINFSITSKHKIIKTWFDHDAIEKILKNLLSNAFKFTPNGGKILVKISKQNTAAAKNSDRVIIEVKNSGSSITEDEVNNIFERFYSKSKENGTSQKGTGIGLAFTKSLIDLHRGSIKVRKESEDIINFLVSLPSKRDAYEGVNEISIKEKNESDYLIRTSESEAIAIDMNDEIEDSKFEKKRSKLPMLLIVDDNKDIRTLIKSAFKQSFKILEASDGKEGLEMVDTHLPNIIITDLIMPNIDGIEFCNILKGNSQTSHIPIIMLTAKTSKESELEGLRIGADGYVKKPFDLNLLRLKLENILKFREELRRKFNREVVLTPEEVTVTSMDETFLQRAIAIVEKHMMNTDFNVELLVNELGLSRSHVFIKIKELTGLSSSAFIRNIRLKRAVQLLEQNNYPVKEIMYMTGFNTSSYFSQCFKKQFGMLPRDYIKKLKLENKDKSTKIFD